MGNYNMREKLSHESGIVLFLMNKGFSGRRGVLNQILIDFLKENNLRYVKHNPKYKGTYDALNRNCTAVHENWNKFHKWIQDYLTSMVKIDDNFVDPRKLSKDEFGKMISESKSIGIVRCLTKEEIFEKYGVKL